MEYLEPLDSHTCTQEELGIKYDQELDDYVVEEENREGTKFFKPKTDAVGDITYYRRKFRCLEEKIGIAGDYNTE